MREHGVRRAKDKRILIPKHENHVHLKHTYKKSAVITNTFYISAGEDRRMNSKACSLDSLGYLISS